MATREQLIEDFADHKYATGEKFARLINSMKVVQEPVETPAASGTSLSFIDSIEQDKDGKITVTKKRMSPTVGSFQFVANDATAEAAFTAVGAKYSGAISGVSPSADTLGVILLMNDDDTTPTKTMMITTEEVTPATNPATYQFVYVGDLSSALPSGVLTVADIVNGFTGGVDKVLSAEAGANLNENKLDKVERNVQENWSEVEPETGYPKVGYVYKNGSESSLSSGTFRVTKCSISGGEDYYITGKTGNGNNNALASFLDGDGNVISGSIYGAEQASFTAIRVKRTAPANAMYILVMGIVDTDFEPKCETKEEVVSTKDNEAIIDSVGDVNDLETTDKSSVVNAINEINEKAVNAEEGVENKLDKIIEEEVETWEIVDNVSGYPINGYLYQDGTEAGPTLTTVKIAKFEVEEGKTYYITGSTTTSTHQCIGAFYDTNGDVIAGSIIHAQEASVRVSREQHTAPSSAKYLKVMQNNSATDYPAKCETNENVTTTKNNQTIIDSVGDVSELDTENKDTIVNAINELNGKISGVVTTAPNVLLIGSSHGMNTISQLPWMLYGRGYRGFKVGNIYGGSMSIEAIAQYMMSGGSLGTNVTYQEFNDNGGPAWGKNTSLNTYPSVLNVGWDVISIQRAAYEDEVWDCSKASAFRYVINYIKNYCADHSLKTPRIIINSGFTDGNATLQSLDTANLAIVHNIMDTVKEASKALKVDYYPTAMAIANARNTWMGARASNYGIGVRRNLTYDGQHLDYGMGCWIASLCLYECIMKPLGDSIQYVDSYGTQEQQYVFTTAATSTNYTEPTEETMQIARDCVWAAYNDDSELNTEITAQYNYPYKVEMYASGVTLTGNDTKKESVAPGGSYGVGFEAVSGFTLSNVYVEMNGVDITSTAYDSTNHSITITNVNGDIKIIIKTTH